MLNKDNKPMRKRIKFEMRESVALVVDDSYCKIYRDSRSGKTFKVINDEEVPIDNAELNMWRGRQRNPAGFTVKEETDAEGYKDFIISRNVSGSRPTPPTPPMGGSRPTPPTPPMGGSRPTPPTPPMGGSRPTPPTPPMGGSSPTPPMGGSRPTPPTPPMGGSRPTPPTPPMGGSRPTPPTPPMGGSRPTPPTPPMGGSRPTPPAQRGGKSGIVTRKENGPKPSRVKFEESPTTEIMLENEFFKLYKDTRFGKTYKVINGEVVPLEQREINFWKKYQQTPQNFIVEKVEGPDGTVYDYCISRNTATDADVSSEADISAASAEPQPNVNKAKKGAEPAVPSRPPVVSNRKAPEDQTASPRKAKKSIPKETTSVGTAPTDRVKFEESPTTEVVVDNEYCKIYKNTRSGKTFKVINGMIAPIELRELNMWKNRSKNKNNFTVEIMKDASGVPFDYIISRINEDGTLTKAPAVAPYAPYIPPENEYVPTSFSTEMQSKKTEPVKPAQVYPIGKPDGAKPAKEAAEKVDVVIDRITFEETPSMSLVVDNEFFKIYNDYRRGKTFKVIDGKIVPIELRELNMWKNRQRKPKNFAVEIVKTTSGEIYDYKISRTANSTTAAVESTSTKTNMPPVTMMSSNASAKKRRPNAPRTVKCAICGNEFAEKELLLFDNRNFCSNCVEDLIKAKLEFKPVDPVQKVIDDVVGADELYCTYSTVTNYPYLDEEFCVNVCTIKKAAEISEEDTAVQTIDDKDMFFDDLKRFGLKKIIINGDTSKIYEPEDFDKHLKTEGVIAPKLYFKVLNFMQHKDDELREGIAACFIESCVYTYALNDEITEVTEENMEDFKPLAITDGRAKFCPVFTDFTEAKNVGMPFRGLYVIDADLLSKFDFTHYIINPSSLGFIMNKSILKPYIDEPEKTENESAKAEAAVEESTSEPETAAEPEPIPEPKLEPIPEPIPEPAPIEEKVFSEIPTLENIPEPMMPAGAPFAEPPVMPAPMPAYDFVQPTMPAPAPAAAPAPVADQFFAQPIPPVPVSSPAPVVPGPAAEQFYAQPAPIPSAPIAEPAPIPAPVPAPNTQPKKPASASDIVIKSNNPDGSKKTFKVSMPVFIPDDPNADIDTSMNEPSALQKAINKSKAMFEDNNAFSMSGYDNVPKAEPTPVPVSEPTVPAASTPAESSGFSFNDFMSDSDDGGLDIGSLLGQTQAEAPAQPEKPKMTIQQVATKSKMIARDLEIEPDVRVAQILKDQLNESSKELSKLICTADVIYAEYDSQTKHILIDGNNKGHIFSEKIYADKSVENFAKNGINVFIKEYKTDELFNMLYEYKRHGIQDLVLDETANWIIISTDTLLDVLDVDDRKYVKIPVSNPELMFSMTTLFQKLQIKNDNPKRKQEIQSLEKRMIREFTSARYILPMVVFNGTEVRPLSIEGKNGIRRVLVFTDQFELNRLLGSRANIVKDYEIVTYKELLRKYTVQANTVVVLNEGSLRFEFNEHNCEHINKVLNQ